jgi:hypothetical protein
MTLLDRRNPLTPAQEKRKKAEASKHNPLAKPDQVYAVYNVVHGQPKYFYVGISIRPSVRWGQHQRAARLGVNTLPEYEQMRYIGVENCYMEVLDPAGEFTEAEWRTILTEQGHILLNVAGCVDVKRKKRQPNGAPLPKLVHCKTFLELMGVK